MGEALPHFLSVLSLKAGLPKAIESGRGDLGGPGGLIKELPRGGGREEGVGRKFYHSCQGPRFLEAHLHDVELRWLKETWARACLART